MSFAKAIRFFDSFNLHVYDVTKHLKLSFTRVGSRETFTGPHSPDSDWDYLTLTNNLAETAQQLYQLGWVRCGKEYPNNSEFFAVRKNEVNLIITNSPEFYKKFLIGTAICKRLNVARKEDRIFVFDHIFERNLTT